MSYRIEKDYLGEVKVPKDAYWGVQTQRAVENFPISGLKPLDIYIKATAIMKAADEVIAGKLNQHFVVDVYQAGAGTSHNMNANEVIANRAIEILGGKRGDYSIVHPNDDVNMGQSTNDVIPTVIRLASLLSMKELLDELEHLASTMHKKALEFDDIIKSGRTHLMDAAPIRLGQEFDAWAWEIRRDIERLKACIPRLSELNIGATAVGTGLN